MTPQEHDQEIKTILEATKELSELVQLLSIEEEGYIGLTQDLIESGYMATTLSERLSTDHLKHLKEALYAIKGAIFYEAGMRFEDPEFVIKRFIKFSNLEISDDDTQRLIEVAEIIMKHDGFEKNKYLIGCIEPIKSGFVDKPEAKAEEAEAVYQLNKLLFEHGKFLDRLPMKTEDASFDLCAKLSVHELRFVVPDQLTRLMSMISLVPYKWKFSDAFIGYCGLKPN